VASLSFYDVGRNQLAGADTGLKKYVPTHFGIVSLSKRNKPMKFRVIIKTMKIVGIVIILGNVGGLFTWTGNGQTNNWSEGLNWTAPCINCYPQSTADDALFNNKTSFLVNLDKTLTIDDLNTSTLEISLSVFDGGGTEHTLTCDTVTISGFNGHGIEVINMAAIETN